MTHKHEEPGELGEGLPALEGQYDYEKRVDYPHLVVRLTAGVYQREPLAFLVGPEEAKVAYKASFVLHPEPFLSDGSVSPACKQLLIDTVQEAVRKTRLRMSLVWSRESCTYVEKDSINHSKNTPAGGVRLPNDILFDEPPVPLSSLEHDEDCGASGVKGKTH